jgi:D-tyrosyl-tRNA(Tyr) deacylase
MRAVVQRVSRARVLVGGRVTAEIGTGIVALVGVAQGDADADADWIAAKIAELRIFPDEAHPINADLIKAGGAVIVVSQFTLLGDARRGRRPGFTAAAPPEVAEPLVDRVATGLRAHGIHTEEGIFGAHMDVELINDGPVTILLDSRKLF